MPSYWLVLLSRIWMTGIILVLSNTKALAQNITLDGSLGTKETLKGPEYTIPQSLGRTVGNNLFHSFDKFNLDSNEGAIFQSNANIQNILSRVTGGNQSVIDGLIRTQSGVNLFFLNPNGIIFGKNARLDVGGSFVVSTANALQFGKLGYFSATEKNVPSSLLTINPSALLFNQINQNAAIQNMSVAPAGKNPVDSDAFGLRVPDGKSLLVVGGNVSMDGGQLNAFGGRVELGGLTEPAQVNLLFDANNLRLGFPENVTRGSVSLTNQAGVLVQAAGGGDIAVNAGNLEILGGSRLLAGIARGLGTPETVAGDITLNATGEITVADSGSAIANFVRSDSKGNGGNITINAGSFKLRNGVQLAASTFGQGNAGSVTVNAKDAVQVANANIYSTVEAGGVGKGGDININAATLSLQDVAQLQTITRGASLAQPAGKGDAGNVNVKVSGTVDIAGARDSFYSGILSLVAPGTEGNGGNITIDAGSFKLRDGAQLSTTTFGQGSAGSVTVNAKDAVQVVGAYIISAVEAGGVGKGGNININAATLSLQDGAELLTSVRSAFLAQSAGRGDAGNVNVKVSGTVDIYGEKEFPSGISSGVDTGTVGNGGNIIIDADSFKLHDGAQLSSTTFGQGNAGNVRVTAKNAVQVANASIFSTIEAGGMGKGGDIDINAATLSLQDGAQLLTSVRSASLTQLAGRGDAGNVNVKVSGTVDITGKKYTFPSAISSGVDTGTVGNGGNIIIDAGSFKLGDGAQIDTSTSGQGWAGNVTVNALYDISFADNAAILSTIEAGGIGKGGNININAETLTLRDGAQLLTITRGASDTQPPGRGNAGNVNVKVSGTVDIAGVKNELSSGILSSVFTKTEGRGGNITVDASSFKLRDGALLDARTSNNEKGGDITVNTNVFEALIGGQITTTTSSNGRAGKITVNAKDKVIISTKDPNYNDRVANFPNNTGNIGAFPGLFVNSTGLGTTGDIEINSPRITLDNQGKLNANSASGNGGNINLNSDSLLLRRGSKISTNAGTDQKGGDGGNININSTFTVAVPFEDSDITANAFDDRGGNVTITKRNQGIFGIEARSKESPSTSDITASSENGAQGKISIAQPNTDPNRGLIELPTNLVDASQQIAQGCTPRNRGTASRFISTGRGGIPENPYEPLRKRAVINHWVTLPNNENQQTTEIKEEVPTPKQIVEAQGWVLNSRGEVELVAQAPEGNFNTSSQQAAFSCNAGTSR
ncbi:hypothetical protein NIES2101_37745 [Calothrix sp. HK-06]|nr:hypothetical protein NIES2101_37745 [Calothrix sp. HK-06]